MADIYFDLLTEIRDDVKKISTDSTKHDGQLRYILGNGQPGKLKELEIEVESLKELKWKIIGMAVLISGLIEIIHIGGTKILQLIK